MHSEKTLEELKNVVLGIESRIKISGNTTDTKELEYLLYQKVKVEQLIDDLSTKKSYFKK